MDGKPEFPVRCSIPADRIDPTRDLLRPDHEVGQTSEL